MSECQFKLEETYPEKDAQKTQKKKRIFITQLQFFFCDMALLSLWHHPLSRSSSDIQNLCYKMNIIAFMGLKENWY